MKTLIFTFAVIGIVFTLLVIAALIFFLFSRPVEKQIDAIYNNGNSPETAPIRPIATYKGKDYYLAPGQCVECALYNQCGPAAFRHFLQKTDQSCLHMDGYCYKEIEKAPGRHPELQMV